MVTQTYHLLIITPPDLFLLGFVFCATILSYSFHWYLTTESQFHTPRIDWTLRNKNLHFFFLIFGAAGTSYFFFKLLPWWHWLAFSAIITFLYSAPKVPHPLFKMLRRVAIGKTIFLSVVWMYVTTVLPIVVSHASFTVPVWLFIIHRYFLIYAICIIFDFRDREDDKNAGIKSMVTAFCEKGVDRLFIFSLAVFTLATCWLYNYHYSWQVIAILLLPGFITAGIYQYAKKNMDDYLYYFLLDGLMMFSGLLMLIAGI